MNRSSFLAGQAALLLAGCAAPMMPNVIGSSNVRERGALPSPAIVGEVRAAAGALPKAWLPCDGRLLSTDRYRDLFAVLGYSSGRRGSEFRLPRKRGYAIAIAGVVPTSPQVVERVFNARARG